MGEKINQNVKQNRKRNKLNKETQKQIVDSFGVNNIEYSSNRRNQFVIK